MLKHAAAFSARQHYQAYDGIHIARARWLLPRKIDPSDIPTTSLQGAQLQSALIALNLKDVQEAGGPGRYLLPDHPHDEFDELAGVMATTHRMARAWTAYNVVQVFTLVLLMGRWVYVAYVLKIVSLMQSLHLKYECMDVISD